VSRDDDDPDDAGKPPLPPEKRFDPTTVDELLELVAALLADEAARGALSRAVIHGDFTSQEKAAVEKVLAEHASRKGWRGSTPTFFQEDVAKLVPLPPRDTTRDPLSLALSVPLARWIAAGEIPDIEAPEARAFLEDRLCDRPGDRSGFLTKKATATEVMWVARDLMANPIYWGEIQKAGLGDIDEKVWHGSMRPIEIALNFKYGLFNRGVVNGSAILRQIAVGKIDSLDSPAAWEFIRRNWRFVRDSNTTR